MGIFLNTLYRCSFMSRFLLHSRLLFRMSVRNEWERVFNNSLHGVLLHYIVCFWILKCLLRFEESFDFCGDILGGRNCISQACNLNSNTFVCAVPASPVCVCVKGRATLDQSPFCSQALHRICPYRNCQRAGCDVIPRKSKVKRKNAFT
jgi:hypothetical protein